MVLHSYCLCFCAPFFKLIWSNSTASQDFQISIYHLPQLWDQLLQQSVSLTNKIMFLAQRCYKKERIKKIKRVKNIWQKCQKDYKYPFPDYGTSATHAHRTHTARWSSWQDGKPGHTGGRLSVSFPTAGAVPQITTKLATWTFPPHSSASLCAP